MYNKIKFDIVKRFNLFAIISLVLIAVGLISLILLPFGVNLFNLDIEFAGGTSMNVAIHTQATQEVTQSISAKIKDLTGTSATVQSTGDGTEIIIKSTELTSEQRQSIFEALKEEYSLTNEDLLKTDNVSSVVGQDFKRSAFLSCIIAAALMLLYITIRFEFKSGLSAVICLIHDILVMLSVYVILQIPLNLTFVAAALTIFGYSINASIITFDRIRENNKAAGREAFENVVEKSIWQTVSRSINTTLTTLFTVIMLLILGVQSLKDFAIPLMIGMLSGTYSSVFLAGPLWVKFKGKPKKA